MPKNIEPKQVWEEYERGVSYKQAIDLFDIVEKNEAFYAGDQWRGVNAPDLPKPTLNFLKRVVSYFIAMIVSDDIAVSITPFQRDEEQERLCRIMSDEVTRAIELAKIKPLNRDLVRNAAVDGDACIYLWYDPDAENGQPVKGQIRAEAVENINVMFCNPHIVDVQSQRYIVVVQRRHVQDVRDEAEANNSPDVDRIVADSDDNQGERGTSDDLCTVLTRLWRDKDGIVWAQRSTHNAIVREAWSTGYRLYPIAYMPWERVRSSCHGRAVLTGLIPNQIAVNKLFAMAIRSVEMNAFPKIIYDNSKIKQWSNRVGEAIGVAGPVNEAFVSSIRSQDMSAQVMDCVDRIISMTRDFMGASDAALGNVKPNNTSAIIAVQQASAIPLELPKKAFYQFVEDYVRIIVDMMRANYGIREVTTYGDTGNEIVNVDFDRLGEISYDINVDVGPSAYWSEQAQMQTLDNLFAAGVITDAELYLEAIPDKYVPNKAELIQSIRAAKEQTALAAQMQAIPQDVFAQPSMPDAMGLDINQLINSAQP